MKGNLGTKPQRKHYGAQAKAKAALAAIRAEQTANEIASFYGTHPLQVGKWKAHLIKNAPLLFDNGRAAKSEQELIDSLYRQVGKLQIENEWFKKKSGLL